MSNASITNVGINNVGKKYKVVADTSAHSFPVGSVVELCRDDGTDAPLFEFAGDRRWIRYSDLDEVVQTPSKMTPCEKLGYKTGDKFTHTYIRKGEEYFTQGQVITLTDDGSGNPRFEGMDDSGKEDYWYLTLEDVTQCVEPVQETPIKLTPAQELGYKVGDKFIIKGRDCHCFSLGSEVVLTRDDNSHRPLFGNETTSQYVLLTQVTKVEESSQETLQEPTQPTESNYLSKLRDKIAMQQLAVLTPIYWDTQEAYSSGKDLVKCQVESAYEYADEMLKQRLVTK